MLGAEADSYAGNSSSSQKRSNIYSHLRKNHKYGDDYDEYTNGTSYKAAQCTCPFGSLFPGTAPLSSYVNCSLHEPGCYYLGYPVG